jgi:hypothetical protein
MESVELQFCGKTYAVPKKYLIGLLEHRGLLTATSYAVESSVPLETFEAFLASLQTQTNVSVTKENAASLWLLGKEFALPELLSECSSFSFELLLALSERVSVLEREIRLSGTGQVEDRLEAQEEELESLSSRFEALESKLSRTEVLIEGSKCEPVKSLLWLRGGIERLVGMSASAAKSRRELPTADLNGIISYLTAKHGGNVHERGLVRIASKSVQDDDALWAPKNVADLTLGSRFWSGNEPGQWICWDFGEMRVRVAHYTIEGYSLKSWVVEGSPDGEGWQVIDRQKGLLDFKDGPNTVVFDASNPVECRFIRLTQTDRNHCRDNELLLYAVEFFGTLWD